MGVCKSSNLVKLAVSNAALLYLSAKEIAEYGVRLPVHLDMLLLSAAEAVDHPEELVAVQIHLFCERCESAESAPYLASSHGDLVNAILGHTGHCLQTIGRLQEGSNFMSCRTDN